MIDCKDTNTLLPRLKRIEGQIRGIHNMIEKGEACEDILIQIGAAKSALHKTGQYILEGHLHHCIADSIKNGEQEIALDRLSRAIEQFARLG